MARYDKRKINALLADAGIVRNRMKIDAAITNARALAAMHEQGETLVDLLFSFGPDSGSPERADGRFRSLSEVPSSTPSSTAMAKALKARGFRFVGPVVAYALMQSAGIVDDHVEGCWVEAS